jgi:hypothetical protein
VERARATRTACLALAVAFAAVLSIPLKLAGGPSTLRTIGGPGSSTSTTAVPEPPPVSEPELPLPVLVDEGPGEPFVTPDLSEPAGMDGAAGPTVVPAAPPPVPPPATPASAAVPGTRVKAVVVGVNDYPGSDHDLRSAVADERDMTAALARAGVPPQNVVVLEDGAASAAGVLQGVQWLVDNAGPDDTAIFFFSGHARSLGFGSQALVGSDGWLLTDRFLAERLRPLRARATWIVLSVCYGGGFDELLAPGRMLTAAAPADSLAYENESFGRSYLGQYLVRLALQQGRSGGPIVQQAVAWAQAYLARDAPDRQLSQFDLTTEPLSIDGVHRANDRPPDSLPPPGFTSDGEPLPDPGPPVTVPAPAPPPPACRSLLQLFCPR